MISHPEHFKMSKRKFIIDCDAGVDDAFAILLALSREDVEVIAITCVGGNTEVDQVCVNVMKVLEACNRTHIPVYKGAGQPLLGHIQPGALCIHGMDGLGDASNIKEPDMSGLQKEHGVDALLRLAADDVTLVALGPLTNVALACRLDAEFAHKLKRCVIMGGNCEAKGNDGRPCSEFNFHFDPEAAYVTLNEVKCPLSIITLEVCQKHYFSLDFVDKLVSQGTRKADFLKNISQPSLEFFHKKKDMLGSIYVCYDLLAMSVALYSDIVSKGKVIHATVELSGRYTRGQMVVDWMGTLGKKTTVFLVQEISMTKHTELVLNSVL